MLPSHCQLLANLPEQLSQLSVSGTTQPLGTEQLKWTLVQPTNPQAKELQPNGVEHRPLSIQPQAA